MPPLWSQRLQISALSKISRGISIDDTSNCILFVCFLVNQDYFTIMKISKHNSETLSLSIWPNVRKSKAIWLDSINAKNKVLLLMKMKKKKAITIVPRFGWDFEIPWPKFCLKVSPLISMCQQHQVQRKKKINF